MSKVIGKKNFRLKLKLFHLYAKFRNVTIRDIFLEKFIVSLVVVRLFNRISLALMKIAQFRLKEN